MKARRRFPLLIANLTALALLTAFFVGCGGDEPGAVPSVGQTGEEISIRAAMAKLRSSDTAGAVGILEKLTAREPENAQAWVVLGRAQRQAEQPEAALEAYEKALTIDSSRHGAAYGAAEIHAVLGEPTKALEILEGLKKDGIRDLSQIDLDPDFASLRDDPRYRSLLPTAEELADPFVEDARVIHEWVGEAEGDEFGWVARNVGDVDGDGVADAAVSAPSKNVGGETAGRVYLYSGRSGELLWSASGQPGDRLGVIVDTAGDVDGDGGPDVVAGAPGGGRVLVYRGRDGEVLLELRAAQEGEEFGQGAQGAGDLDGDGHGDLLVGAPNNDEAGEDAGRAAVYSGKDGSLLHQWLGREAGDKLGSMVAANLGAGPHFLMLGAPDAGAGDRGQVEVYVGLADTPQITIESDAKGAELGRMFLSVVGDVDADGVPDLYASDFAHSGKGSSTGRIVVHSGADGKLLLELGGEATGDGFGIGPADAGDVDGDGHADLVVGAWQQRSAAPAAGKVYLYSGKDGTLIRAWTSKVMGETFGFDATGLGDVDGDGQVDLLLTSAWSTIRGAKSGRVWVLSGR